MTATVHSAPNKAADHRLRKHADFQRVYRESRRQTARQMAWFCAPRSTDVVSSSTEKRSPSAKDSAAQAARIGLTVPKAIGNAVTRNRIKRRMRAAVRKNIPALTVPVDVVLHPRRTAADVDFPLLEQDIANIFARIQRDFAGKRQPS